MFFNNKHILWNSLTITCGECGVDVKKGRKIMSKKDRDLLAAKKAKKNEFYTRLEDIELEIKNYREYFKDT